MVISRWTVRSSAKGSGSGYLESDAGPQVLSPTETLFFQPKGTRKQHSVGASVHRVYVGEIEVFHHHNNRGKVSILLPPSRSSTFTVLSLGPVRLRTRGK